MILSRVGLTFIFFFFFNDTATTEIYTLSLHDALPISIQLLPCPVASSFELYPALQPIDRLPQRIQARIKRLAAVPRSEEHTSELQSRQYLVCRLLLEKKKKQKLTEHNTRIIYPHHLCA